MTLVTERTVDLINIFEAMPGNFLVLQPDPPLYTILTASDDWLRWHSRERQHVIGKSIFEVFPQNASHPFNLRTSFDNVIDNKKPDQIPLMRCNVANEAGVFEERYQSVHNKPVLDKEGNILCIIHSAVEVTDQIKAEKKQNEFNEIENAYHFFVEAPVAICVVKGPAYIVELANESMLQFLGRTDEVKGKPLIDSLPEADVQGLTAILDTVRKTKQPFFTSGFPATLLINGIRELRYFDLVFKPYYQQATDTEVTHIFCVAHNITAQVLAQKKAEESEKRFRDLISRASVATAVYTGREMKIEYANEAMLKMMGKDADVIGKTFIEALPEMKEQPFIEILTRVYNTGQTYNTHGERAEVVVNGKRQTIYVSFSYKALRNPDGEIYGILNMGTDVTEQMLYRKKIEESEQNFRHLVMQAPIGICIVKGEPPFAEIVNDRFLELLGKPRTEFEQKPFWEVVKEAEAHYAPILANVIKTGEAYVAKENNILLVRNGQEEMIYIDFVYEPVKEDGTVTSVMMVAIDVTAKVEARRKIEESEQQIRSFVESAPFPIGVYIGREMRIRFANQTIMDVWGKGNDVTGKLYADVLPELQDQQIFKQLDEVFTTGIPFHARNQRVDLVVEGRMIPYYFNYSFTPLYDAEGKVYGVMNTAADVTDLNIAHKKIEESEKNLRNIILQAPVAMCILRGADFVVEIANDRMFELWGRQSGEMLNKPIFQGLPEVRSQGFEAILDGVYTTGKTYSAYGAPVTLPRNGSKEVVYVNFVYEAFREGDGTISGVMVVATDVTEHIIASKKIEEAEERARLAIESAELGTYDINLLTNEIVASGRMGDIFDVTHESERERYITGIHPEDLQLRREAYKKAFQTGLLDYNGRVIHKDGSLHWIRVKGKIYYNAENTPVKLLGVTQDITEQKLFSEALAKKVEERTKELAHANEHLAAMNKELEQFTYAASHDMQEPLRKVLTFSSFLLNNHTGALDDRGRNYITKIVTSVNRMQTIIDDLLNYSHQTREAQEFKDVDLNNIIENIEADLELIIQEKKAAIKKDQLPQIAAVPAQMNQLFYNLFSNALKFSRPEVPVQIEIRNESVSTVELVEKGLDVENSYCKISFSDNGIGFDQQYADQIFSLFKRLHGRTEYEGTGIGLGLCKKIVQNHKGSIWAESQLGKGASFYILLPA